MENFYRHRRAHKRSHTSKEPVFPRLKKSERSFVFQVHRSVRPVLERIKVPEPRPFVPDPFQNQALEALEESDVLVTAPTGAGKTYIAVKAIQKVFSQGGRAWYASPLKALSNAKYEEFCRLFEPKNVGILTGDRKENVHASIVVGTTEILRNQLYDMMHRGEDLAVDMVVLDEAHYLGDRDRGVVWEEVLIYLPPRVKLLLLSATIQNAQEICDWLKWLRHSSCRWVSSFERPVPLYPLFMFPTGELGPLSTRRGLFAKIRTVDRQSFHRNQFPDVPRLMEVLRQADLLPAIFFLKSRADCERAISLCPPVDPSHERLDAGAFRARLHDLMESFPFLRNHQHLPILEQARVGAHHGGQLPHWKLFLERLMQEGCLDAIFSTSTVAAGVNFPARTVVVLQSDRFNGKEFAQLTATELLQMTGRAGRRGMDEIGFVLVVPGFFQDPQLVHDLLRSSPDTISSQIKINASMVLNLLLSHKPEEIRNLFAASFATFQNLSREIEKNRELQSAREEIREWLPEMLCGSLERLAETRPLYVRLKEQLRKARKHWKGQASMGSLLSSLTPGRVVLSRRGTPYVVVADPQMEHQTVEAVRMVHPLRMRKGWIRTHLMPFHRIRNLGRLIHPLPAMDDRTAWQDLLRHPDLDGAPSKDAVTNQSTSLQSAAKEVAALMEQIEALPCRMCTLYGPCQKTTSHPFDAALQRYFEHHDQIHTIQEQLWRSFLQHYRFLHEEGYVTEDGRLTEDGTWASKLRLDQPLLISEGIRKGVFPVDNPELLAALIAPFVMDRDRPGDYQLSTMVYRYPDLAEPFFKMLESLQPLREHLTAAGFIIPPLPFWTLVTIFHWARGGSWDAVREIAGMDEGDLAMVILRTADHLRQIESLSDTHPRLAASARKGIELILREPVLML